LREDANLLVGKGFEHGHVWLLPLGMLWTEAILARRRVREEAVMQAVLIHAAIVDAIGGGGHLRKVIGDFADE
jgi:hypothetical protein